MDFITIGEMVIDFLPGQEKEATFVTQAARRKCSNQRGKKRTSGRHVLQGGQ